MTVISDGGGVYESTRGSVGGINHVLRPTGAQELKAMQAINRYTVGAVVVAREIPGSRAVIVNEYPLYKKVVLGLAMYIPLLIALLFLGMKMLKSPLPRY